VPEDSGEVRILINPKSGLISVFDEIRSAVIDYWDAPENRLKIQFSKSKQDGQTKAWQAVREGVKKLLVVGGDGIVNSIGSVLVGTDTALGVIPAGSGNGFARHFNIPLDISEATIALAKAKPRAIDVGFANGDPFFVTCSLAWDAALVDTFEKSPVRGVFPYVFAGVYKFFEYHPQPFHITLDEKKTFHIKDPQIFTIANLTQYGGGAQIAPEAKADDGKLQLVYVRRKNFPKLLLTVNRMFNGSFGRQSGVETRSFQLMTVQRQHAGPMQLDGELIDAPAEVTIHVRPRALNVLVPSES
jgi:YegS/Rv2252/BmrU family lipid kinase